MLTARKASREVERHLAGRVSSPPRSSFAAAASKASLEVERQHLARKAAPDVERHLAGRTSSTPRSSVAAAA
jgi:hypothetical protein